MVFIHRDQKYLELAKSLVFEDVDTLWQNSLDRSVEGQHERCAFGIFVGRFNLYRDKFDGVDALCLNRERVANYAIEQFVSRIREIHRDLIFATIAIGASYDSIFNFEYMRIKQWPEK